MAYDTIKRIQGENMRELREVIIAWNYGWDHWRPTRWQHTKRCEVKVELRSTSTGEVIQRLPAVRRRL
jgi:hypothetical protein